MPHGTAAAIGEQLGTLFDESTTPDQVWQALLAQPDDVQSAVVWQGLIDGQSVTETYEPRGQCLAPVVVDVAGLADRRGAAVTPAPRRLDGGI